MANVIPFWYLTKGTLLSATADGNTVSYSYNANTDALEQVAMNTQNGLVFNGYEYTDDMLSKIKHNGFEYTFQYDAFGNRLSSKVGDQLLMSQSYAPSNGKLLRSDYGNGHYFQQTYDILDRMVAKTYNEQLANQQTTFEWKYDTAGTVKEHRDIPNNTKQLYDYDSLGRLVRSSMLDASSNEMLQQSEYGFDLNNNVTKRVYSIKGQTQVNEYTYGKDNLLMSTKLPNGVLVSNTIDRLNRVEKTTLELPTPKVTSYAYSAPKVPVNGSTTTTQLYKETIDGEVYEYRYDNAGNITEIWKDGVLQSRYGYDDLYQLVTEYDAVEGTETRYTYDNGGNILNRYVVDAQTGKPMEDVDYGYDAQWKDKLVSYDGQPITYDPIGNPLNYLGYAMTWQRGRQLATLTGNGVTASYQYNADGMRTTKTVNGMTSKYYYAGTQLMAEERGSDFLQFYYDAAGIPRAFKYNADLYYYRTNSRGDITGLYGNDGTLVVEYTYDAWGNPTGITGSMADTVGQINPLRYRGYYYDAETGFYYLGSRYYDSVTCRMLSADVTELLTASMRSPGHDKNLFAYCDNNPVLRADGEGAFWHIIAGAAIGAIANMVATAVTNVATGKDWNEGLGMAALSGALSGGLAATGLGVFAQVAGNALISGAESIVNQGQTQGFSNISLGEVALDAAIGGALAIGGGISKGTAKHVVTQGKNATKRVTQALVKTGVKAAVKETKKAAKYYVKQTLTQLYKPLFEGGIKDIGKSIATNVSLHYIRFLYARAS